MTRRLRGGAALLALASALCRGAFAAEAGVPPAGEPVEATEAGFHTATREYRIDAPLADVWRLYTTTSLQRLLPNRLMQPTLLPYQIVCPGNGGARPAFEAWPTLRPGLEIQSILHWGVSNIHQDMDVTEVEPMRRIGFRYASRGPAEGDQTIEFRAGTAASGQPSVRVFHSSHYRGKNILYASLYSFVHKELLDAWHLGAKYYLESRLWAAGYCEQGAAPWVGSPYQPLFERALRESQAPRAHVRQAFCLYSQRFLGPASDIPKSEAQVAHWVAELAARLGRDGAAALAEFQAQAAADEAAVQAGAAACGR